MTIRILGTGRVRILPGPKILDSATALCLERPRGHRLTLATVPVGQRAKLVAVAATGADVPADAHCKSAEGTGFVLGSGVVWANQPAPGVGPADQIGFAANADPDGWNMAVLDRFEGRTVQLESHPVACGCVAGIVIPRQRTASGQEARR